MASTPSGGHGHLDAAAGRTVVFCHACHNEWFEDERGQEVCPNCGSDIIELVSVDNDPRELYQEERRTASPEVPPHPYADDSDPEEADISEHVHYPPGFMMGQRTWDSRPPEHDAGSTHTFDRGTGTAPFNRGTGAFPSDRDFQRPGDDRPPETEEGEAVFRRFVDMIGGFGMNRMSPGSPMPQRETHHPPGFGDNVRRTTFTSPNGMHTTSVTITSGPIHFGPPRTNHNEFPRTFRTILGGMGPPQPPREGDEEGQPAGQGAQRDPTDLLSSLQELLTFMVDPANARHGDAVYSQEALDRIISGLMDANPQSNAAPPASESAIANLEKRAMDETMIAKEGGKAECTVCIDEIKVGDEVVFLPCKHWFHEACVTMWLKEHNTCPICRTPIEQNSGGGNGNRGPAAAPGQQGQTQGQPQGQEGQEGQGQPPPPPPGHGPPPFRGIFGVPIFFEARRPEPRAGRSPHAYPGAGASGDREDRWPNTGGSRRSSMSPPNTSDGGSRTRTRSPSTNSRRSNQAGEQEREGGSRPLRWLQDRFGGRPERRQ